MLRKLVNMNPEEDSFFLQKRKRKFPGAFFVANLKHFFLICNNNSQNIKMYRPLPGGNFQNYFRIMF
jgi:hypothetical protein